MDLVFNQEWKPAKGEESCYCENAGVITLLLTYPARLDPVAWFVSFMYSIKFFFSFVSFITFFTALAGCAILFLLLLLPLIRYSGRSAA